jgi:hypothetical protein
VPDNRSRDYFFGTIPGAGGRSSSIRVDDTILPGCTCAESKVFGVQLRPTANDEQAIRAELAMMLSKMVLMLQLATENSPGERKEVAVGAFVKTDKVLELLRSKGLVAV